MWVFDGAVASIAFVLSVVALISATPAELALFERAPDGWAYVLVAGQTLPIAFRRVRPVAVLGVVVAAFVLDRMLDYPSSTAAVGVAFAFHSLGSQLPRKRSLQIGLPVIAVLVAFTAMGARYVESVSVGTVIILLIATLVPLLLGREVNERRRYLTELEERAVRLEHDREQQARRAVREERTRIARELHDVVAHEMTVMTVQAAAARRVISKDPDQASEALTAIESAGHDALAEMRRLLGLLRHEDGEGDLLPQPGLGRLSGLMEQMEESGLPTSLVIEGDATVLPAGIDLSAYRIIQESLTNSLKHGGPHTKAAVRVVYEPDQIFVEVEDDGRGSAADPGTNGGAGHGLVGMRERIAMLDGSLTAGPRPGGGFMVRATIPRLRP